VVVSPHGQACCGALLAHNGDLVAARELARRNVDAFLAVQPDAIVVNSAGCGAAMKEYETLLADDPEYASKAVAVAGIVRDVSEFLVELPLRAPVRPLNLSVTYQDSCHLSHAQRITDAPRQVLRTISGLKVVEMRRPDRCCGSAGVYGWTQAEMSLALLDAKVEDIESTGADVVATSNPGCIAQIDGGLRRRRTGIRVTHVVELLAKSYASI
jgi:glycolate oxidase iron-sulfur subunit